MKNYKDFYGRYHDKEVFNGEPSSGNGFIYTAYAMQLGLPINIEGIWEVAQLCSYHSDYSDSTGLRRFRLFNMDRNPGQPHPPISKDEIVGLSSLGVLDYHALKDSKFSFYNPTGRVVRFSFKSFKALLSLRGKHRNTVWQDKVYDAFPFAFRLMLEDKHYVRVKCDSDYKGFLRFSGFLVFIFLNFLSLLRRKHYSGFNLAMFQLKDLYGHGKLFKLIYRKFLSKKHLQSYIKYFGNDHVFTKRLRKNVNSL